ncbi:MAG: ribonuclease III [Acidimicrobiia bacterium]|nr:ribonuclease III [Acidimicrobiia bacterium]
MSKLRELETALSYTFSDIAFLEQAMVHRSYGAEFPGYESNERFEFLGDTVLQLIVTDFIFHEYPDLPEGELAKIRAASVNRTILFEIARELGVGMHLQLGKGEEASGGREKASILADAMEAVLAAVYLDSGLDECKKLIMRLWEEHIRVRSTSPGRRDFKTRLQEILAQQGRRPRYRISAEGPDHEKSFTAELVIDGEVHGRGTGRSKKAAEQMAAEIALVAITED